MLTEVILLVAVAFHFGHSSQGKKKNWRVCITAGAREQICCLASWTGIFQINCLHFFPKIQSFIEILMYVQESFLCYCGMVSKGMGHTVHQDLS